MKILDKILIKPIAKQNFLYQYSENIYRCENILVGIKEAYENNIAIDMVEGIVVKSINSILHDCHNKKNLNSKWQFKFRKPTKCYQF